jgi:hypothetical protein
MKNPCKKCLIRPGCSIDCDEVIKYISNFSQVTTFISFMISVVFFAIIMGVAGVLSNNLNKDFLSVIWLISSFVGIWVNIKQDTKVGPLLIIIFAPFMAMFLCLITLSCGYTKKYMRQRV